VAPDLGSRLGLGTGRLASLGSGNTLRTARAIVEAAFEEGVRLIDTADTYGSTDCESWLGKVLEPYKQLRISTKAGCRFAEFPGPLKVLNQVGKKALQFMGARPRFDSAYLTRCIDGSLRRLRRDRIDFFFLHDPPLEAVLREEWRGALLAAKAAGKVDQCGVSSPSKEILFAAAELDCCDILQMPLHATHAVALAVRKPIVVNHVFGTIVTNPDVESISKTLGLDSRSTLIAHAVSRPRVECVLSGTRNAAHLRANVRAAGIALPAWANDSLARLFAA
jgi:pyridoxine 4-dehydrogenase